ncbi:MAG: DUF3592 domain-containing protein, partial [Verrucomicrobia bacterium]|nr:DUF3592 domain-containing protein [Verrucomicrobiota bacterium]
AGGCGLAILAAAMAWQSLRLLIRGVSASGTVVGYKRSEGSFLPIVEFTDRTATQRRFTSTTGLEVRPYAKGARVLVVYDPAKPQKAEIRAFWSLWLFPVVTSVIAAAFLAGESGVLERVARSHERAFVGVGIAVIFVVWLLMLIGSLRSMKHMDLYALDRYPKAGFHNDAETQAKVTLHYKTKSKRVFRLFHSWVAGFFFFILLGIAGWPLLMLAGMGLLFVMLISLLILASYNPAPDCPHCGKRMKKDWANRPGGMCSEFMICSACQIYVCTHRTSTTS